MPSQTWRRKPTALTELSLTLPVFLFYHLGVVFMDIRNATDFLSQFLLVAANGDLMRYLGFTLGIGFLFFSFFFISGRAEKGERFDIHSFFQIAGEGILYAIIMRAWANFVVDHLFPLAHVLFTSLHLPKTSEAAPSRFVSFVMSLGAGFYEEVCFRVMLFGVGCKLLIWLFAKKKVGLVGTSQFRAGSAGLTSFFIVTIWALICSALFSGMHYIGRGSDMFEMRSFFYRASLGFALTLIYTTRGFAAAVWTHSIYDLWVLVFS